MGTYSTAAKKAYEAALKGHWNLMICAYHGKNIMYVMSPVTVSKDTSFHLAVYSKSDEPLKGLLGIFEKNPMRGNPCTKTNAYGNTVLHEAIVAGNMEAVQLLLKFVPKGITGRYNPLEQLQTKNVLGETPLYKAASCGQTEIMDYLADKSRGQISDGKLLEIHHKREDSKPILHAALEGQHFETVLKLLELDPSLHELKDNEGKTCLHLLADMPGAFRSGYAQHKISFGELFYRCLRAARGDDEQRRGEKGWPMVDRIRNEKHKHESALKLAKELIEKNQRYWWQSIRVESTKVNIQNPRHGGRGGQSEKGGAQVGRGDPRAGGAGGSGAGGGGENNENVQPEIEENRRLESPSPNPLFIATSDGIVEIVKEIQKKFPQGIELVNANFQNKGRKSPPSPPNPLFIATSNGIVEIVHEILQKFPQGIELVDETGLNILHVAVMHRQKEIFRLVKKKNIVMARLSSMIDNNGYTLLHQVAHVKHYSGGTAPGPALQLQEELKWFKRVLKVVPPHYAMQRDKENNMTANELFQEQHKSQLKMAQDWIEKTSQSCSAVAVLVATVVFAAAYTIPGGSDDRGFPIFLHNSFFMAFTVMDVVALASSLTSVVMFLSILTTPFECEQFYHNIPRKLICGFTLLFFSVMTTMLAFACTLFLVIRLKKPWTTGLISVAAFLPVSVFAIMQFPLYLAFLTTLKDFCKGVLKALPWWHFPFRCLFGQRKTRRR